MAISDYEFEKRQEARYLQACKQAEKLCEELNNLTDDRPYTVDLDTENRFASVIVPNGVLGGKRLLVVAKYYDDENDMVPVMIASEQGFGRDTHKVLEIMFS